MATQTVDHDRHEAGTLTEARLFGGQALVLMDKAAFIAASRYSCRAVVTASSRESTSTCSSRSMRTASPPPSRLSPQTPPQITPPQTPLRRLP